MSDEHEMTVDDGANGVREVKVNYQPNSNKSKAPKISKPGDSTAPTEKKVERIVTDDAVQRKRGLGRKIRETFTGDDMNTVGNYILFDVVLPAAKDLVFDAFSEGLKRAMFGGSSGGGSLRSGGTTRPRTNYNGISRTFSSNPAGRAGEADGPRTLSSRARSTHDFSDIVLKNRGEAEEVIDALIDLIDQFQMASVYDLYEMVGVTGAFTDNKWGWTDLRNATVRRVRDGYLLDLPRPVTID